jgi:hypothetical protein
MNSVAVGDRVSDLSCGDALSSPVHVVSPLHPHPPHPPINGRLFLTILPVAGNIDLVAFSCFSVNQSSRAAEAERPPPIPPLLGSALIRLSALWSTCPLVEGVPWRSNDRGLVQIESIVHDTQSSILTSSLQPPSPGSQNPEMRRSHHM